MTLIADAGPLVALGDRRDPHHAAVRDVLAGEDGRIVVPLPVAAEVDYLLGRRGGRQARLAFLGDVADGRFEVAGLSAADFRTIIDLEHRYADQAMGLADLSVAVVAHRLSTDRILTFDRRHFAVLRPLAGSGSFTLLP